MVKMGLGLRSVAAVGFFSWILVSCQSAPVRHTEMNEGSWSARSLVRDKEKNKSYIVMLDFNVIKNEQLRLDVSTTLGQHVASLYLNPKEVRYLVADSKSYYFGSPRPEALQPILSVPIDPRFIHNILFDLPIEDKSWVCSEKKGLVELCENSAADLTIKWSNRLGVKRTIFVDHKSGSVQINIQSFRPKVENKEALFQLEAPSGFKKLRVR